MGGAEEIQAVEVLPEAALEPSAKATISRGVRTITSSVSRKINEIYEREEIWERVIEGALELAEDRGSRSRKDGLRILVDVGKLGVNLQITEEQGRAEGSVEAIQAALQQLPDASIYRLGKILGAVSE